MDHVTAESLPNVSVEEVEIPGLGADDIEGGPLKLRVEIHNDHRIIAAKVVNDLGTYAHIFARVGTKVHQ